MASCHCFLTPNDYRQAPQPSYYLRPQKTHQPHSTPLHDGWCCNCTAKSTCQRSCKCHKMKQQCHNCDWFGQCCNKLDYKVALCHSTQDTILGIDESKALWWSWWISHHNQPKPTMNWQALQSHDTWSWAISPREAPLWSINPAKGQAPWARRQQCSQLLPFGCRPEDGFGLWQPCPPESWYTPYRRDHWWCPLARALVTASHLPFSCLWRTFRYHWKIVCT
jgi:hypothetical protein